MSKRERVEWKKTHAEWEEERDWQKEIVFNQFAFYLSIKEGYTVDEALRMMSCFSRQKKSTDREIDRMKL